MWRNAGVEIKGKVAAPPSFKEAAAISKKNKPEHSTAAPAPSKKGIQAKKWSASPSQQSREIVASTLNLLADAFLRLFKG